MSTDANRNPAAEKFGINLRRCRHNSGLSQEALGFGAGLHRTEVGRLERGQREPRLGTIAKLASTLPALGLGRCPVGEVIALHIVAEAETPLA